MKNPAICENHLFSKAYAKGKKCVCRNIIVYSLTDYMAERIRRANPQKTRVNRLGITAGKRIGGAVTRNRVKRIIREAYRLEEQAGRVKHGFLLVIVARDAAISAKTQDISRDLRYALNKLSLMQ